MVSATSRANLCFGIKISKQGKYVFTIKKYNIQVIGSSEFNKLCSFNNIIRK